jgi:hypothetical protein
MRWATRLASMPAWAGQRALHQQLAHADAEAAGDELEVDKKRLLRVQLAPVAAQALAPPLRGQAPQRQQALLHPFGQAQIRRHTGLRQHQGDGFGQVAHGLVALFEQPVGMPATSQASARSSAVGTTGAACRPPGSTPPRPRRAGGAAQVALQRGRPWRWWRWWRPAPGTARQSASWHRLPPARIPRCGRHRIRCRKASACRPCSDSQRTITGHCRG